MSGPPDDPRDAREETKFASIVIKYGLYGVIVALVLLGSLLAFGTKLRALFAGTTRFF